jgi:serine/threonine protein phosphatase PrpC
VRLTAGGATDAGPRPGNQDSHFIDLDLGLFIVADGMGGHNAGDVASHMAVGAVVDFIRATHRGGDITWPFPMNRGLSVPSNRVDVALRIANQRVHDAGETDAERAGMGTTIVVLLVEGGRIVVGHVGDSRAYLWRKGVLQQMTEDHTWLNAIEDAGDEDLQNHPLRHVLTHGIGMGPDLSPSLFETALEAGDRWLLCSDGVHGVLDHGTLQGTLDAPDPQQAAADVVKRSLAAGTTDNATAIVLNVEEIARV